MPLARAIPRIVSAIIVGAVSACAMANAPTQEDFARMPREIRTGAADMVIEPVDAGVDRAEVLAAVQTLVEGAPMCLPWPGLWLDASNRRSVFYARYDLMARDWGPDVAAASKARMDEFVELGFLIPTERPDIGDGAVEYVLTTDGVAYLRGSPYGGRRPSFCAPAERRVVDLVEFEEGSFECGTLRVRFTHIADGWPHWARTEEARQRVAVTWAPIGQIAQGEVSLARLWHRQGRLPPGEQNGALRSVCMDAARENVVGDDLDLSPAP